MERRAKEENLSKNQFIVKLIESENDAIDKLVKAAEKFETLADAQVEKVKEYSELVNNFADMIKKAIKE